MWALQNELLQEIILEFPRELLMKLRQEFIWELHCDPISELIQELI